MYSGIRVLKIVQSITCSDPESFVRGGPTLATFFLFELMRGDPNNTKSGPLLAH